jgi:hypothetical protein
VNEMNCAPCLDEMLTQVRCTRYIRIILAKKQRTLTVYLLYGRCLQWRTGRCVHTENPESILEHIRASRKRDTIVGCLMD